MKEVRQDNLHIEVKDLDTLIQYEADVKFNRNFLPRLHK